MEALYTYLKDLTIVILVKTLETNESVYQFCCRTKLIPTAKTCLLCQGRMKVCLKTKEPLERIRKCINCEKELSILTGTFFEKTKLPISEIILFIYFWSSKTCSYECVRKNLKWYQHAFVDWRLFIREVCSSNFWKSVKKLAT